MTAANGSAGADGSRLRVMEDPEAYLRARAAPLARVREGSPYPVARLSLEAVANAFVVLGLLPAARAEEIFIAQQPVLEAAGFRVGREIGELSLNPGTRNFQQARAAALDSPRQIPLAVAAGPAGVPGTISGQCSASGETRWIAGGEVLAVPVGGEAGSRGGRPAVQWLEFAAGSGPPVRIEIPSPAAVPAGTA